jgi:hypothetical protein
VQRAPIACARLLAGGRRPLTLVACAQAAVFDDFAARLAAAVGAMKVA